jgi:hypothetical protein
VLVNPDGFNLAKVLDSGARPTIVLEIRTVLRGQQFPHCQVPSQVENHQASRRC